MYCKNKPPALVPLRSFLNWHGGPPHRITREDVRQYLLYPVDAGIGSSWVSTQLSAIRTAFDEMCHRQVTPGLAKPRRPKTLPVIFGRSSGFLLTFIWRPQTARVRLARQRAPRVGKLHIHLKPESSERPRAHKAKVTLSIETDPRPVYLTGIVANEVRNGWVNLQIPPLEQWEEPVCWLTRAQRERIEEPEFYGLLQREIPKRLLRLTPR